MKLLSAYYVLDTLLSALQLQVPLLLTATLQGRCCYYHHFAIEETEADSD